MLDIIAGLLFWFFFGEAKKNRRKSSEAAISFKKIFCGKGKKSEAKLRYVLKSILKQE